MEKESNLTDEYAGAFVEVIKDFFTSYFFMGIAVSSIIIGGIWLILT